MQERLTADDLRATARYLEDTTLDALAIFSETSTPLVIGNNQYFPRPSVAGRATIRGIEVLREEIARQVAVLYTLATALDGNLDVPPALFVSILPYVELYRATRPQERRTETASADAQSSMAVNDDLDDSPDEAA